MLEAIPIEEMVFNPPKGMENYRFYRIEYGGVNEASVMTGSIWLPPTFSEDRLERLLNLRAEDISARYLCNVFSNMRKCLETHNFSTLPSLIEEAQYRAERMEDKIEQIHDMEAWERERIELKKQLKKLQTAKTRLEEQNDQGTQMAEDD